METNRFPYDDGRFGCCEPVARKTQRDRRVEGLATAGLDTPLHIRQEGWRRDAHTDSGRERICSRYGLPL